MDGHNSLFFMMVFLKNKEIWSNPLQPEAIRCKMRVDFVRSLI